MSMTILQLSKQLDISKSGVHYYIKQLELSPSKNSSGAIILSDEECTLISDAVQSTRINNAEGVHTNMHSNVHSDAHTNNTDTQTDNVEDKEENTTNESNNVVEILQSHIDEQRNTIRDLSRMLDQQQQLTQSSNKKIAQLESKIEQYRLEDNSSNVDNRSIKVKRYKVYSSTDESTNEDVSDQTNTNIEDTESNKPKGFFAKLFNL